VRSDCPKVKEDVSAFVIATFPPSGKVARVKVERVKTGEVNGIPVYRTVFGAVENLPKPEKDTVYIVSVLVLQAVPHRSDLVAPDTTPESVVRNTKGQIVAVKGFQII